MAYPTPAATVSDLMAALAGSAHVAGGELVIDDESRLRGDGIRATVWSATFSEDKDVVEAARWIVWEASQLLGAPSASIHDLYMARGRGEVHGFTVPAINLRTQVFDMAATMCRAAQEIDAGAIIFELARSEQEYTFQRPGEYITSVLAGCIAAGWQGPVFVQGDHYQFNAKKYAADPEATTEAIRKADARRDRRRLRQHRHRQLDAGRPLAAHGRRPAAHQLRAGRRAHGAHPRARARRPDRQHRRRDRRGRQGELHRGRAARLPRRLPARADRLAGPDALGITKVSVQTGTSHGGVPLPGGGVATVKLDFGTLERLSAVAAKYGLAGAVQHGASTLPDELFHHFPTVETAEIHLATGFQNLRSTSTRPSRPSCCARSRRGASRTAPTSARPARPTSSSSTRRARRRSARSSASCGSCRPRTRSWPTSTRSCASCSSSFGIAGSISDPWRAGPHQAAAALARPRRSGIALAAGAEDGPLMALSEAAVMDALRTVQEPELGRDIVTLNMVKDLAITDSTGHPEDRADHARLPAQGRDRAQRPRVLGDWAPRK